MCISPLARLDNEMRVFGWTVKILVFYILSNYCVDSFDRSRRYYNLISAVHKYYGTSCVFVVHNKKQSFKDSGRIEEILWLFSNESTLVSSVEFRQLTETMERYANRAVRALIVVTLTDHATVDKFSNLTIYFNMKLPCWLVLFDDKIYHETDAIKRGDNIFHLNFNTEMLVARPGHSNVQEWYCLEDKLKMVDLATWDPQAMEFTLMNNKSLYQRRSDLEKSKIPVTTLEKPPTFGSNDRTIGGMISAILIELSTAANFTVDYVEPVDNSFGTWDEEGQRWTGMIKTLVTGGASIAAGEFIITTSRMRAVDFTLPLISTTTKLYIKQPHRPINWSAYWKALAPGIWMTIQLLIVFTTLLLSLMAVVRRSRLNFDVFTQYLLYIFGIYCQQGIPDFPTDSPARIAFFSIFLSALLVSAAYSAALISFLTVVDESLPFTTLEGFVKDETYRLIVYRNGAEYEMLANANDSIFTKMFAKIVTREELPETLTEAITLICQNELAFLVPGALVDTMKGSLPCKVASIDTKRRVCLAMALSKGNPYNGLINYHVQKFRDHGILNRLKQDFAMGGNSVVSNHSVATLWGVMPIIAILVGGIIIAVIILLLEKLYFERQSRGSLIGDIRDREKIHVRGNSRSEDILRIHLPHRKRYPKQSSNFYH